MTEPEDTRQFQVQSMLLAHALAVCLHGDVVEMCFELTLESGLNDTLACCNILLHCF